MLIILSFKRNILVTNIMLTKKNGKIELQSQVTPEPKVTTGSLPTGL